MSYDPKKGQGTGGGNVRVSMKKKTVSAGPHKTQQSMRKLFLKGNPLGGKASANPVADDVKTRKL